MITAASAPCVLVVDDWDEICQLLIAALAEARLEALSAPNATTARRLAQHHRFAVAVIDVRLPDGDGVALALDLARSGTRSLLMTGAIDTERELARAPGLVLRKPFGIRRFILHVRSLLDTRSPCGRWRGPVSPMAPRLHLIRPAMWE